ncbi:MAG TPA: hypothetical protein PLJ21_12055 [Pseudobdellovibrionaceae bacterium]|nr:hypothetical protein [Pseudobdellovibrionaceae bacterium]
MSLSRKWRFRRRALIKLLPFYLGLKTFGALAQSASPGVGLQSGDHFQHRRIKGTVEVQCLSNKGAENRKIVCRDTVLTPKSFDYFIGPILPGADTIVLNQQSIPYNGQTGVSKEMVNLWRTGFFAKPLLKEGRNEIQYTLLEKNTPKQSGVFYVEVERAEPKLCPSDTIRLFDSADCNSYYSICQQYFETHNYCLN